LIVFPQRFLFSMGVGGMLVSLSAAAVALTLLPALLFALGPRVNALSPRRWRVALREDAAEVRRGPWYRLSQFVMRRPAPIAVAAAGLLIVIGLPFLRIEFTGVDASVLPQQRSARVVDDALRAEFPAGPTEPVIVVARAGAADGTEVAAYARELGGLEGVAAVMPPQRARDLWRIDVVPEARALSDPAKQLVEDVRGVDAPFEVLVGGDTAEFVDQQASLAASLPLALAVLAATTLLILFAMTGSVVLPLKALLMNLLTLSAAFGLLVLIFQDGRFEGLLAYERPRPPALESTQPILLFAVAFGLSTDYAVFLLTRIKEAREAGAGERESVAIGLERTGRIVTYAALLFCIAIGAFATSEVIFIKQVGVGTALAVLIDAFIVRSLLVPSLMALLGRWNWWAPRPLARLHGRLGLGEASA
jgi:RND superfamily putative drug exporter